jgi:hypothetical protein
MENIGRKGALFGAEIADNLVTPVAAPRDGSRCRAGIGRNDPAGGGHRGETRSPPLLPPLRHSRQTWRRRSPPGTRKDTRAKKAPVAAERSKTLGILRRSRKSIRFLTKISAQVRYFTDLLHAIEFK